MKNLGTSILITSLDNSVGAQLAESLSNLLGMHFASCKDIVEYDLFDSDAILNKCGVDYFEKREKAALAAVAAYENAIIYVDYDLMKNNLAIFNDIHPSIFLCIAKKKMPKTEVLSLLAYEERTAYLREICDLTVEVSGQGKSALTKIVKEIKEKL